MKRIILLAAFLLPILFYTFIVVSNNAVAGRLERALLRCQLPPEAELLDSISVAGKTDGNGNGMQYAGYILLRCDLDQAALQAWYDSRLESGQLSPGEDVWVERQEQPVIDEYHNLRFRRFDENATCYRVVLCKEIVAGFERSLWESLLNCDIRGH